jgi:hypothetical protein
VRREKGGGGEGEGEGEERLRLARYDLVLVEERRLKKAEKASCATVRAIQLKVEAGLPAAALPVKKESTDAYGCTQSRRHGRPWITFIQVAKAVTFTSYVFPYSTSILLSSSNLRLRNSS